MAVLSQGGHQELQLHFRHCEGFGCPPLRVRGQFLGGRFSQVAVVLAILALGLSVLVWASCSSGPTRA